MRFCYVVAGDTFTTSELQVGMAEALAMAADQCPLGSVRYELSKLRGKGLVEKLPHRKKIVRRIGKTRRCEALPKGLRAMVALVVLRDKAIKPLLAAARDLRPSRGAQNPRALDLHYKTIRTVVWAWHLSASQ